PGFDPHRQFAFIRYKDDEVLLIIVNFSREEAHVNLMIPQAAFEAAQIPEGSMVSPDLLWGKPHKLNLKADSTISVYLSAADAVVLPIGRSNMKKSVKNEEAEEK
ncbi:MAG: alpha-glucosidase C-terminal domain-containing protein, partial [Muribaculaceae bacterium]|nr:alpha-glucosidase C-terminal domain-containing protein [Muribaculaceae bacterium]